MPTQSELTVMRDDLRRIDEHDSLREARLRFIERKLGIDFEALSRGL